MESRDPIETNGDSNGQRSSMNVGQGYIRSGGSINVEKERENQILPQSRGHDS